MPFNFGRFRDKSGKADPEKATLVTTPWKWRDAGGLYIGWNSQVWLYRELTVSPIMWEDPQKRVSAGSPLATLLAEIGATSKDLGGGLKSLSQNREVHLLAVTWQDEPKPPTDTPDGLREFLDATLNFFVPAKALLIGVRLRPSVSAASKSGDNVLAKLGNVVTSTLGEDVPDRDAYAADRKAMEDILDRYGAHKVPSKAVRDQMESWYNLGRGADTPIFETPDMLYIDDVERVEMAALMGFENDVMYAPDAQWALDAATHDAPASVISIRAELEPYTVTRGRIRKTQRQQYAQMEEEASSGDLMRQERHQNLELAQLVESALLNGREPMLTKCSILMGRRVGEDVNETYVDTLRNVHGIEVVRLAHRQLDALDETLPTSSKRVNPFVQDVNIAMCAYAGLQGFSNLGDATGVFVGLTDPDYVPCYLNPLGAPARNLPASMLVAGDSGSGKTYLCSLMATQIALAGMPVVFINPKGMDSIAPMAELVGGTVVSMSKLEEEGGFFDPFRYADPEMAAEILATHILSVLGAGFTQSQELKLGSGLKRGAMRGARCAAEALEHVEDDEVKRSVLEQVEASTTFALGFGRRPMPRADKTTGMTLIEFDRKLDLPDSGKDASNYTRNERIALAAIRLVTRASLEILAGSGGGALFVDEAWTFLGSSEGLAALQQIGREGRSLNILAVLATQRVADVIKEGIDMEGYLSRVFVMKLMDERDAKAALKLCGLEPTPERIAWLKECGPRQGVDGEPSRGAVALHRDLDNRHSAVYIGPVPPAAHEAFTTNPEERRKRAAARQQQTPPLPG